jgi:hypothetical protein
MPFGAFITPILVNFSGVLLQALVVMTPWPADWPIGLILVLGGLAGLTYRISLRSMVLTGSLTM